SLSVLFFFNDTPTSHISTLSLHDALPISFFRSTEVPVAAHRALVAAIRAHEGNMRAQRPYRQKRRGFRAGNRQRRVSSAFYRPRDRKSTRLNSSHVAISYAVFCLKKKKKE